MKITNWFKKNSTVGSIKKTPVVDRRAYLLSQLQQAKDFYTFFETAYRKGYASEIVLVVDGQFCESSVAVDKKANQALWEYLCNFAAAERYRILEAIDELDRVGCGGMGTPDGSISENGITIGDHGISELQIPKGWFIHKEGDSWSIRREESFPQSGKLPDMPI